MANRGDDQFFSLSSALIFHVARCLLTKNAPILLYKLRAVRTAAPKYLSISLTLLFTMSSATTPKLFEPLQVGDLTLQHRVVMAPLTRFRADDKHVHGDMAIKYYSQRAEVPGTLLVTEGTFISGEAGGYNNVPGIWSDEQIEGWKKVCSDLYFGDFN